MHTGLINDPRYLCAPWIWFYVEWKEHHPAIAARALKGRRAVTVEYAPREFGRLRLERASWVQSGIDCDGEIRGYEYSWRRVDCFHNSHWSDILEYGGLPTPGRCHSLNIHRRLY